MNQFKAAVAIIGGGPVGLALSMFLDKVGISSVLFNIEEDSRWHPKGSTHNSRTMEHYRWLGISSMIRSLGLPADFPKDISYFTRCNSWELARFEMYSEVEAARAIAESPVTHQVPEPLFRSNQMYVERYLLSRATKLPNITLRFGWVVSDFVEHRDGLTIRASCLGSAAKEEWRVLYGVGCDGATSFIRRRLGISYQGQRPEDSAFLNGAMVSSYVRLPTLTQDVVKGRKSWMYNVMSPAARMLLISLDGADEYLLMSKGKSKGYVPRPQEVVNTIHSGAGQKIPVEVIRSMAWTGGIALIAEKFGQGRLFLCGDSCHLFSPTGGYGMNTGIDDARNLAWKLAGCVQGWAPDALLATYEMERRPVAHRNTGVALALTKRVSQLVIPDGIEDDSSEGEVKRRTLSLAIANLRPQFDSLGVELGARYDGSPVIIGDGNVPEDKWTEYTPSASPGGRLPHFWLVQSAGPNNQQCGPSPRTSIFDVLGPGFSLLKIGSSGPGVSGFVSAARRLGVPLKVVELEESPARDLYESSLVLVRPDHHVAWRSDKITTSPETIMKRCIGVLAQT